MGNTPTYREPLRPSWSAYGVETGGLSGRPVAMIGNLPFTLNRLPTWVDEYFDDDELADWRVAGNA